jgi:transposase
MGRCEKGHVIDRDFNAAENNYANRCGAVPVAWVI